MRRTMQKSSVATNMSGLRRVALSGGLWLGLGHTAHANIPQSVFAPAGPVAQTQLSLLSLTMWIAIGIFVTVGGLLLFTVLRFRGRPDDEIPKQIEGNTRLEIIWTVIPVILLAIIAVPTVRDAFYISAPPDRENALEVTVVGYQWWWAFEYPDQGVVTANEMRIPTGRPIHLTLESKDVVHSFWVPRLAGKMDVVPNRTNTMWLQADEPGIYYGQCAEYCGTSHANMRFRVIAMEPADFEAWILDRQTAEAFVPSDDLVAQGHDLFATKGCMACHTVDGTSYQGIVGPDLSDFGSRTTVAAGILPNTPENVGAWLRDPQQVKPGALMPNLNLSDDEVNALTAFLGSLR